MNDTERYLRAATRGLWGRPRRELRAELQGHIGVQVQEFRLGGLSEVEAERQTLRELGAPVQVSSGMLGVHTLPTIGKAGALSLLLMTGLLSVRPQGLAQVGSILDNRSGTYLDLKQLQAEFIKSGGDIVLNSIQLDETAPEVGTSTVLDMTIPGVGRSALSNHVMSFPEQPSAGTDSRLLVRYFLKKEGHTYINLAMLLSSLATHRSIPVTVSGWKNPILSIGGVKAPITDNTAKVAEQLYLNTFLGTSSQLIGERGMITFNPMQDAQLGRRTLSGRFQAGSVYALLVSLPDQGGFKTMTAGIGAAASATKLSLNGPAIGPLKFYDDALNFRQSITVFDLAESKRKNSPDHKTEPFGPYPAVLLKLSGRFGSDAYTIVPSASIK